jgi:uncharacterized RDD family membrane protein YckC
MEEHPPQGPGAWVWVPDQTQRSEPDPPGWYRGRPLASWHLRAAAYLIDAAAMVLAGVVLWEVLAAIARARAGADAVRTGTPLAGLIWLLAVGLPPIVNRWALQGWSGRSVGKRVMRLRLVAAGTLAPPGALVAFMRDGAHLLDCLALYLGWLLPLVDARRQTIADKLVGTLVLRDVPSLERGLPSL